MVPIASHFHLIIISHQTVRASGNHPRSVGVEGGRRHRLRVRRHRAQALARGHVPDLDLLIERPANLLVFRFPSHEIITQVPNRAFCTCTLYSSRIVASVCVGASGMEGARS